MNIFSNIFSGQSISSKEQKELDAERRNLYRTLYLCDLEEELRSSAGEGVRSKFVKRIEVLIKEIDTEVAEGVSKETFAFFWDLKRSLEFSKAFLESFPVGQEREVVGDDQED